MDISSSSNPSSSHYFHHQHLPPIHGGPSSSIITTVDINSYRNNCILPFKSINVNHFDHKRIAAAWAEPDSTTLTNNNINNTDDPILLRPVTAVSTHTANENARMTNVLRYLNHLGFNINDTFLSAPSTSSSSNFNNNDILTTTTTNNIMIPSSNRDIILHELLQLQNLVNAVRTGDITSSNTNTMITNSNSNLISHTTNHDRERDHRGDTTINNTKNRDHVRVNNNNNNNKLINNKRERRNSNLSNDIILSISGGGGGGGLISAHMNPKAGRKSIRMIALELDEKIQLLRNNSSYWDVFCARVESYKAAKRYDRQVNVLHRNILDVKLFDPILRQEQRNTLKKEHEDRRQLVSAKSKRLFEERQKNRQLLLEKSQKQLKTKTMNPKLYQLQMKWLIIGSLASRIFIMKAIIQENHQDYITYKRQNLAARKIQRAWKQYKQKIWEIRRKWAIKVLGRAMSKFIASIREQRRQQAANTIRDFLKEIHDVGKLIKVIKKYRYAVITAQRVIRNHLLIRNYQLYLLELQWIKLEPEFWLSIQQLSMGQQKNSSVDNNNNNNNNKINKRINKKKQETNNQQKGDKKNESNVTIPHTIRNKLLIENLIERRKKYIQLRIIYDKALEQYEHKLKESNSKKHNGNREEVINEPPKRPYFKVLLNKEDMLTLINQARSSMT